MAESRRMWGGFSYYSILVLVIILLSSSGQHCAADAVKKNKSISNQCGGSDMEECLLSDNVELEFLLDSDASRRALQASSKYATSNALDPAKAVQFCGRPGSPPNCTPLPNTAVKVAERCNNNDYNKLCHRLRP